MFVFYYFMSQQQYGGFYYPERFIGEPGPEQMAAHIIDVYSFKNLFWYSANEQYLVPAGKLQRVLSVDLGTLLPEISDLVSEEARKKAHRRDPKNDENLKWRGAFKLPESLRHLNKYFVSVFKTRKENISYSFAPRKDAITLERPLEFHIIEYLAENQKIVAIHSEKVLVWAQRRKNTNIPAGDFGLRYLDNVLLWNKSGFNPLKS